MPLRTALFAGGWLACAAAAHQAPQPVGALRGAVGDETAVWVMTYNVSFERVDRATARAIAEADADLVVLQETHPAWETMLREELASQYPTMLFRHAERDGAPEGGMALLSRHDVLERSWSPSPVDGFHSWCVQVETPVGELDVVAVHLHPPLDSGSLIVGFFTTDDLRLQEIEAHVGCFDGPPDIVLGDFNEGQGKAVRHLEARGYEQAQRALGPIERTWSWDLGFDELKGRPDHIFSGPSIAPVAVQVMEIGASDHRPLRAAYVRRAP